MRYASKVDVNQKEIVNFIRNYGASVLITSQLKNAFDILVGYNGFNIIMEIKDGLKPPSQRKLTKGEQQFKDTWQGGKYHIVKNIIEVEQVLKSYDLK